MNTKILAQNIVNNPSDFTSEQIEKYFEDYAKLRLSAVISSCEWCGTEKENPNGLCRECGRFPSPSNYS